MQDKKESSRTMFLALSILLYLGSWAPAGCGHGIEPPLEEWLDSADDHDKPIEPEDTASISDSTSAPSSSDEGATNSNSDSLSHHDSTSADEPTDPASTDPSSEAPLATEPEPSRDTTDPGSDPRGTDNESTDPSIDSGKDSADVELPCLIISEYVEGSAKNKGVELLNCGDEPLILEGLSLCTVFNAETECGKSLNLNDIERPEATLAPWDVLTVCYSGIDEAYMPLCDHTHALAYFNGDDRLLVKRAETILDAFGEPETPPEASPWKDVTLRRCDLQPFDGSTSFDAANRFSSYPIDDFNDFGLPPLASVSCEARQP